MQGGINNAGLFGASQREARSKLDQMAGIKRPSGILASSPELMRAAMPTPMAPAPMPMAAPAPMAMPMAPAPAPMPMPTTVSAAPTPAPAPRSLNPMAQAPAGQKPVVKLEDGGFLNSLLYAPKGTEATVSLSETGPINFAAVNIFKTALDFAQDMDKKTGGAVTKQFGSVEAAAKEGTRKANIIESAAAATKDPSKVSDAVLVAAGEQPTDAAKMDFAENVFGLKDVNDIDEINRRIANVAIGGSVAKSPEEFTQAVLLGLQTFKQTAAARAEAKADAAGGGFLDTERGKAAVELYIEMVKNQQSPSKVEQYMNDEMGDNIGTIVRTAITGGSSGGAPTAEPTIPLEARRGLVEDALKQQPQNRKVILEQAQADGVNIEGL